MESRQKMKDLVNAIQEVALTECNNATTELPNHMVEVESSVAFEDLMKELEKYKQDAREATLDRLGTVLELINKRQALLKTDCSPFCCPNSKANVFYKAVRREIARMFNENFYEVMYPNIIGLDSTRHLHEYILRDAAISTPKGEKIEAILVLDAFKLLEEEVSHPDDDPKLTQNEEELLANHSEVANEYYWEVKFGDGPDSHAANVKRKRLEDAITLVNYKIKATYPECYELIVSELIKQRVTRESFLTLLTLIPENEWDGFMLNVDENEFFRLAFNIHNFADYKVRMLQKHDGKNSLARALEKIEDEIQSNDVETHRQGTYEDKYIRALGYISPGEAYLRTRPYADEYKSNVAHVVGRYTPTIVASWGGYFGSKTAPPVPREVKIATCKKAMTALQSSESCMAFLESKDFKSDPALQGGRLHAGWEKFKKMYLTNIKNCHLAAEKAAVGRPRP